MNALLLCVVQHGCRIVSPLVVLYCLQQQRCVPKAEKPVYNMAMADVTISCTSLEKAARVSSGLSLKNAETVAPFHCSCVICMYCTDNVLKTS